MTELRLAKLSDAARIASIEYELQVNHGWSEKMVMDAFTENGFILVAEENNCTIAYAVTQYILDEAELHIIGVDRKYQRKGVATLLLKELVKQLIKVNVKTIFLEVRKSNVPAISLYARMGFTQSGVRKNYYKTEEGREDAIIMSCKITLD